LHDLGVLNFLRVHSNSRLGDGLAILECCLWNSSNRVWRILVHIGSVHDRRSIDDCGVVDIRDFGSVDHAGIRYVYV
jgi:hypothetical protein